MSEVRRLSLVKPTLQTPFHIDYNWWSQRDSDWRVHLQGLLCSEHQKAFSDYSSEDQVDFVDPYTAEVQQLDGVQHVLITHCARQEGFITEHTTLVDAIFRTFIANGNEPMTPLELAERLNRPAQTILRVLSGGQFYRGMRPVGKG